MQSINIPATLKEIPAKTFYECENLKNVGFFEGIEKIGIYAFCSSSVESVTLPASLRTICEGAFRFCKHLKTILFGEEMKVLGADDGFHNEGARRGVFE